MSNNIDKLLLVCGVVSSTFTYFSSLLATLYIHNIDPCYRCSGGSIISSVSIATADYSIASPLWIIGNIIFIPIYVYYALKRSAIARLLHLAEVTTLILVNIINVNVHYYLHCKLTQLYFVTSLLCQSYDHNKIVRIINIGYATAFTLLHIYDERELFNIIEWVYVFHVIMCNIWSTYKLVYKKRTAYF